MDYSELDEAFRRYGERHPGEAALAREYREFLRRPAPIFERIHAEGHFTGSAWVVSGDGERVLLTHHRKLGLWLQPGGHADGDVDLARVALREAQEETGVPQLALETREIFDLDRHAIPARRDEPRHLHWDVRYVVRAGRDERFVVSEESHALAWRPVREVAADAGADPSVRRMAQRWLARTAGPAFAR
jgi:8-oxo-dGTP pyrophosphatase MutT (NUDIX family)